MNHLGSRRMRIILIGSILTIASSCAPQQVQTASVKGNGSSFVEKELVVTGRPIISTSDLNASLQIENFYKPNGERCYIYSPVEDEILKRKLDPAKTYRFHLYTTHQNYAHIDSYHAMLSKVEEAEVTVIDASICDVHGCRMKFGAADQVGWSLKSPTEQRHLKVYHNHGYDFAGCCSGGLIRWNTWVCLECRKKVDAFKSKYAP